MHQPHHYPASSYPHHTDFLLQEPPDHLSISIQIKTILRITSRITHCTPQVRRSESCPHFPPVLTQPGFRPTLQVAPYGESIRYPAALCPIPQICQTVKRRRSYRVMMIHITAYIQTRRYYSQASRFSGLARIVLIDFVVG